MSTLPVCQTLLLELHNGVLHITLNRPDSRNAMSLQMVGELRAVLAAVLDDRVEHGPEHVIDERGKDPSVERSEGVEQVGAHVELGSHGGGADVGRADPEVRR